MYAAVPQFQVQVICPHSRHYDDQGAVIHSVALCTGWTSLNNIR
jgi:hypothetical protein